MNKNRRVAKKMHRTYIYIIKQCIHFKLYLIRLTSLEKYTKYNVEWLKQVKNAHNMTLFFEYMYL